MTGYQLEGYDTFSGEPYPLARPGNNYKPEYPTYSAALEEAYHRLHELELTQPTASTGGQLTGVQDRVYIVHPDGRRERVLPRPAAGGATPWDLTEPQRRQLREAHGETTAARLTGPGVAPLRTSLTLAVSTAEQPVPGIPYDLGRSHGMFVLHATAVRMWVDEQTRGRAGLIVIADDDWVNRGGVESLTIPGVPDRDLATLAQLRRRLAGRLWPHDGELDAWAALHRSEGQPPPL
jgi:hypothetical protein